MRRKGNQIITLPRRQKNKSHLLEASTVLTSHGQLSLNTDGLNANRLRQKPTPDLALTNWSMGDPRKIAPSGALWGRSKWELHVLLSLHNGLNAQATIYDLHACTYHTTGIEMPLAAIIHRPRIEISLDNSILTAEEILLAPGEVQPLRIVLETSLYDTVMTTVVFGIIMDVRVYEPSGPRSLRLPSDRIYIFQQHPSWGTEKCHFVSHNT